MTDILTTFKNLKVTTAELKAVLGNDLHNVENIKPVQVSAENVIFLIEQYISHKISTETLLDWVNIVWFTDLFYYNDSEEDSIASVMSLLETLDENETHFTHDDFKTMIISLKTNVSCTL